MIQPGPIEKAVPLPLRQRGRRVGKNVAWQFCDMDLGDSFAVDATGADPVLVRMQIINAASRCTEQGRRKFTTRILIEHGRWVVRCWRLS